MYTAKGTVPAEQYILFNTIHHDIDHGYQPGLFNCNTIVQCSYQLSLSVVYYSILQYITVISWQYSISVDPVCIYTIAVLHIIYNIYTMAVLHCSIVLQLKIITLAGSCDVLHYIIVYYVHYIIVYYYSDTLFEYIVYRYCMASLHCLSMVSLYFMAILHCSKPTKTADHPTDIQQILSLSPCVLQPILSI